MPIISCRDINMSYDNYVAIKDISFEVEPGDYLCIVGENGSGKSTLMKGILKLHPLKSGTITLNGIKQTEIGYLPQQTMVQKDFPASVYEVILSGCLNRRGLKPFYSKNEKKIVNEKIEQLGIGQLIGKSYRDLSGGQQQRVLLARALCATDKLILLDEPVTGLDPVVTAEFYNLIQKLNRENGVTVIMVSHDIEGALSSATKVLHLHTKTMFYGNASDYKESAVGRRMLGGNNND